jgi:hypothetical protein
MSAEQEQLVRELSDQLSAFTSNWRNYWSIYSLFSWQFWILACVVLIPLLVLFWKLDRQRILQVLFYGLGVHVVALYCDLYGTSHAMWVYPFVLLPFPTASFGLDASLIPVAYMLMYQWTVHRHKNYYLYMLLMCAVFAFGVKPLMQMTRFIRILDTTYWELFLFYVVIGLVPKLTTDLFLALQRKAKGRV